MVLLGQSQKLDPHDQEYAILAAKDLGRVVHLVRQALGFYQEGGLPTVMNVETVLESVLKLYANQIEAEQITLTTQF